jgi:hypothetical protein
MLHTQRTILLGATLVLFFILLTQCLQFIKEPKALQIESFTSMGPTRPDDCLCLPGYVPSNTKDSGMGGIIVDHEKRQGHLYYLPSGSRIAYWIPSCNIAGIDINFCSASIRRLTSKEWTSMIDSFDKTFTKQLWDSIHSKSKTDIYFCQKLTDSSDTKKCTPLSM